MYSADSIFDTARIWAKEEANLPTTREAFLIKTIAGENHNEASPERAVAKPLTRKASEEFSFWEEMPIAERAKHKYIPAYEWLAYRLSPVMAPYVCMPEVRILRPESISPKVDGDPLRSRSLYVPNARYIDSLTESDKGKLSFFGALIAFDRRTAKQDTPNPNNYFMAGAGESLQVATIDYDSIFGRQGRGRTFKKLSEVDESRDTNYAHHPEYSAHIPYPSIILEAVAKNPVPYLVTCARISRSLDCNKIKREVEILPSELMDSTEKARIIQFCRNDEDVMEAMKDFGERYLGIQKRDFQSTMEQASFKGGKVR